MFSPSRRSLLRTMAKSGAALGLSSVLATQGRTSESDSPRRYLPTLASLNTHPLPGWFEDAKLGIFLHWGLYSVPGFAVKGTLEDVLRKHPDRTMTHNPYAEDYWNALRDPSSPTAEFHRKRYGNMPYQDFREAFNVGLANWQAREWVKEFKAAGAGYVVLTAKYADGYCLWPSQISNPHEPHWTSQRDIVGELAAACREEGLRFGVYYSGGVDWSFTREPVLTMGQYILSPSKNGFANYAQAQIRELVERYEVDVLWNDVGWCTDERDLYAIFADYYNARESGVVNDRWNPYSAERLSLDNSEGWNLVNEGIIAQVRETGSFFSAPQVPPHCDFITPEWVPFEDTQAKKWEMCLAMGTSWGFNAAEGEADFVCPDKLLFSLIDAAAKNGNLLINLGPRGDNGQIPSEQLQRLRHIGSWMRDNGEALRGTRPWTRPDARSAEGYDVRFTRNGTTVNIIIWGRPTGQSLSLPGVVLQGSGRLLADNSPVLVRTDGFDAVLNFAKPLDGHLGLAVAVTCSPF